VTVADAYAEVERVTRRRARNFAYGIMVLPKAKRTAIALPIPVAAPVTMATLFSRRTIEPSSLLKKERRSAPLPRSFRGPNGTTARTGPARTRRVARRPYR